MRFSASSVLTAFAAANLVNQAAAALTWPVPKGATGVIEHEGKVHIYYGDALQAHAWNLQQSGYDGVEFTMAANDAEHDSNRKFAEQSRPAAPTEKDPDGKTYHMDEKPPAEFKYVNGKGSSATKVRWQAVPAHESNSEGAYMKQVKDKAGGYGSTKKIVMHVNTSTKLTAEPKAHRKESRPTTPTRKRSVYWEPELTARELLLEEYINMPAVRRSLYLEPELSRREALRAETRVLEPFRKRSVYWDSEIALREADVEKSLKALNLAKRQSSLTKRWLLGSV